MRVHQKQLPIRDARRQAHQLLPRRARQRGRSRRQRRVRQLVRHQRPLRRRAVLLRDRPAPQARGARSSSSRICSSRKSSATTSRRRSASSASPRRSARRRIDGAPSPAARLCKTDLVTEMVKEFTDLQGKHRRHLRARRRAARGRLAGDLRPLPAGERRRRAAAQRSPARSVSLADRIDTLVGFFSIGAKPTGSKDPFGLRRAAQGVVQILLNRDKRQIGSAIDKLDRHRDSEAPRRPDGRSARATTHRELLAFFAERVRTILEASAWQFAYDEIAAAMEAGWASSLTDLVDRIAALKAIRDEPNFLSVLDSAKRIENITAGHDSTRVDPSQLEHASRAPPQRARRPGRRADRRHDRRARSTSRRWSRSPRWRRSWRPSSRT